MRVLRPLLIGLLLLLLLLAGVVGAFLSPAGQTALRNAVAGWASREISREVHIDGDFRIEPGRTLRLSAAGLRLANSLWGSRPDMLLVQRLTVEIDARSLLSDTIIISAIRAAGFDLSLERNGEGASNWDFNLPPQPQKPWLSTLPVVVDQVDLPGAQLQFIGPRLEQPLKVRLDTVRQTRGANDMLELSMQGRANDTDMQFTGEIGPFASLVAAKNFQVAFDGHIGAVSLTLKSRIDDLARPVDSEVNLQLRGPDAAYVTKTLGIRNLGEGPFSLDATASKAPDGGGILGKVAGQLGGFDIEAEGEMAEPERMDKLNLRTRISGPDLSLLGGIVGIENLPAEKFRLAATIHRSGEHLTIDEGQVDLLDSELTVQGSIAELDKLAGYNLRFHVTGPEIQRFRNMLGIVGISTGAFDVTGTLQQVPAGQDLLDVTARTSLGTFTLKGPLGAYPKYYGTSLQFSASGPDFVKVAQAAGLSFQPPGRFDGRGTFEWTAPGIVLRGSSIKVGDDQLTLDGLISTRFDKGRSDFRFGLQGRSLKGIGALAGFKGMPPGDYQIAGRLQRQQSRTLLDGVDIRAAGARLQVTGGLGTPPAWLGTQMKFTFSGSSLAPFAALLGDYPLPKGPFRAAGSVALEKNLVRLDQVTLGAADAEGQLTADIGLPFGDVSTRFDLVAQGPDLGAVLPVLKDQAAARQKFDVQAKGSWRQGQWSFDVMRLETPRARLNLKGSLDQAPDFSATALAVDLHTNDLATTARSFGYDLPAGPFDLKATLSGTPTTLRMNQVTGKFGQSDFSGDLAYSLGGKPSYDVHISSDLLDLTPFTGESLAATAFKAPEGPRMIADWQLPQAELNRANATVAIKAKKTIFLGETYDNLVLRGTLQNGQLTVDPVQFGSSAGQLNARLQISPAGGKTSWSLDLKGQDLKLSLVPGLGTSVGTSLFQAQVNLTGTGNSSRDLVASVTGPIRLVGSAGQLANNRLTTMSSDFLSELLLTINPLAKRQPYTQVVCQAYLLQAGNGVVRTDPSLVMRTTDLDVIANGTVDLRTENIDFNFKTAARGGLGFSAAALLNPYIKVTGTLMNPKLTVDPTGALVNGGAAFATGGLSIVATTVWDRIFRQRDPCASAVAEAGKSASTSSWW